MTNKVLRILEAFSGTITIVVFVISYLVFDGVIS